MLSLHVILTALSGALVLIAISLLVSRLLVLLSGKVYKNKYKIDFFWSLFTGLFVTTSCYAIYHTKGITILLFIPFLLFFAIRHLPQAQHNHQWKKDGIFIMTCFAVQFLFFIYSFSSFNNDVLRYLSGDFNIYFRMAQRLNLIGVEAYNFNLDTEGYTLPNPYHFGDLWVYALCAKLNYNNPTGTFLSAFSVLALLFTVGLRNYIQSVFPQTKKWALYILMFAGLFAGIKGMMPSFLSQYAEPYTLSVFNWGKVLVLACSVIALLLLARPTHQKAFQILLVVSGLLYINAIPALLGAYCLLMLILLLRKQEGFAAAITKIAVPLVIILAAVLVQYKLLPAVLGLKDNFNLPVPKIDFLEKISGSGYIKRVFNIFIGGWFQIFTVLPYILLFIFTYLESRRTLKISSRLPVSAWYLMLLFPAGLLSWAVTYPYKIDTVQFFHNILAPLYAILITLVLFFILNYSRYFAMKLATILLISFSIYQSAQSIFYVAEFSTKDWNILSAFIDKTNNGPRFVSMESKERLNTAFLRKSDQYVPLNILTYKFKDYTNVSLSTPFLELDTTNLYYHEAYDDIQTSSFAKFIAESRAENPEGGIAEITGNYIRKYKIGYFSLGENVTMPDYMHNFTIDSCYLPGVKTYVYLLNNQL